MARCIVTGRGVKGAMITCETQIGYIAFRALKVGPYRYDVYSEYPRGRFKTVIYARNYTQLRRRIEEWLDTML